MSTSWLLTCVIDIILLHLTICHLLFFMFLFHGLHNLFIYFKLSSLFFPEESFVVHIAEFQKNLMDSIVILIQFIKSILLRLQKVAVQRQQIEKWWVITKIWQMPHSGASKSWDSELYYHFVSPQRPGFLSGSVLGG